MVEWLNSDKQRDYGDKKKLQWNCDKNDEEMADVTGVVTWCT